MVKNCIKIYMKALRSYQGHRRLRSWTSRFPFAVELGAVGTGGRSALSEPTEDLQMYCFLYSYQLLINNKIEYDFSNLQFSHIEIGEYIQGYQNHIGEKA